MRPSFHCASAWPCSAAYCSELTALSFSPARSAWVPERNASDAGLGARPGATPGIAAGGRGIPRVRGGAAGDGGAGAIATGATPGVATRGGLAAGGPSLGVPSRPSAGASPKPRPVRKRSAIRSDVRIALLFRRSARMRDGTGQRRPDLLGVLPQVTGGVVPVPRLPFGTALG